MISSNETMIFLEFDHFSSIWLIKWSEWRILKYLKHKVVRNWMENKYPKIKISSRTRSNDIANSPQYCRLSHWTRTNVGWGGRWVCDKKFSGWGFAGEHYNKKSNDSVFLRDYFLSFIAWPMFYMTMKGGGPSARRKRKRLRPPSLSCRTLGTEWRLKK